ncbi:hypothetical protein HG530_000431 [Fusarium avenaceum]|nr:hypothetical protein HG530_000431 [Fusarium avenaceum]
MDSSQRLPACKKRDKLLNPFRSRIRPFRRFQPLLIPIQRRLKVLRNNRVTRRRIRPIPPPVTLRRVNLRLSSGFHTFRFNQRRDFVHISLRPHTTLATRREALNEMLRVKSLALPVNPAVA